MGVFSVLKQIRAPLCRTYTNLTNIVKSIYYSDGHRLVVKHCCRTSCFNVHCLPMRSYTDSAGVLHLLATRGDVGDNLFRNCFAVRTAVFYLMLIKGVQDTY